MRSPRRTNQTIPTLALFLVAVALSASAPAEPRVPVIVVMEPVASPERAELESSILSDINGPRVDRRAALAASVSSKLLARKPELSVLGMEEARPMVAAGALAGWIDPARIEDLRNAPGVAEVIEDVVLDSLMNVSVPTLLPTKFYSGGFRGGVRGYTIGVLDAGIDAGHPAFSGLDIRFNIEHFNASRDSTYNDSWTNPDDLTLGGHGTHIAGIIAGRAAPTWENYLGVAPASPRIYNLKSGFRRTGSDTAGLYFSDALSNIDWGLFDAGFPIQSLNFSWGIPATGDDSGLARFFDAMVDNFGVPVFIAAGNGGPNSGTLTDPAIAYNVLTIGATNDAGTINRLDDNVTGNSSRGPTPGGRKKPDLVAPGFIITSPTNFWETMLDLNSVSGTSFAAPHALGAAQLVMDYMGPARSPIKVKALLIASATPGSVYSSTASVEWDPDWGWGYINLDRAWDYRQTVFADSLAPRGQSGDYRLFRGPMSPVQRAAIAWNRHVTYVSGGGQPSTAGSLNNLDLRLYNHADGTLLDSSTSTIDNVEVVTVTLADYDAVVKVYAQDTSFSRVSLESYALATPPGFTMPDTLPRPRATMTYLPGNPGRLVATVENTGEFNAHSTSGTLSLPSGASLVGGLSSINLGTLLREGQNRRIVEWWLAGDTPVGSASLGLSSSSYGETFTGSSSTSLSGIPTGLTVELATSDRNPPAGEPLTVQATVTNASIFDSTPLSVTLGTESGLLVLTGSFTQQLPALESGESATATWTVSAMDYGRLYRLLATAEGMTVNGGLLGGGDTATITTLPAPPMATLGVEGVYTSDIQTGQFFEVAADVTNFSPLDAETVSVTLEVPSGFILASGSSRQSIGAVPGNSTTRGGRWLIIAPAQPSVGDFVIEADNNGASQTANTFRIAVGRELPPPASPHLTPLTDDPLLQKYTGTSDNDPRALAQLPDGTLVFFNAQAGNHPGHRALLRYDGNLPGTASMSVLAARGELQGLLTTQSAVLIEDIEVAPDGTLYLLASYTAVGESTTPWALLGLSALPGGGYAPLRLLLPPGALPFGLPATNSSGEHAIAWDSSTNTLVLSIDDGLTASDPLANGLYRYDPSSESISLIASCADLAGGLRPQPNPGSDPMGFRSPTIDAEGRIYLLNVGGIGGNRGDILRFDPVNGASPFADDSLLLQHLPQNYASLPTRLHWNQYRRHLGILVSETASAPAQGDTLMTEWTPEGDFARLLVSRTNLLFGTGTGLLLNEGDAFTSNFAGDYMFWSASDNERVLNVKPAPLTTEVLTIY